nr:MAG TPA: hypothetical protein [Caudoviricetes sp.]
MAPSYNENAPPIVTFCYLYGGRHTHYMATAV